MVPDLSPDARPDGGRRTATPTRRTDDAPRAREETALDPLVPDLR